MGAAPHQDVAKIDRNRRVTDADLSGTGLAQVHVLVTQNFGAAVLMEAKSLAHGVYASACASRCIISTRSSRLKRGCAKLSPRSARGRARARAAPARSYCRCR